MPVIDFGDLPDRERPFLLSRQATRSRSPRPRRWKKSRRCCGRGRRAAAGNPLASPPRPTAALRAGRSSRGLIERCQIRLATSPAADHGGARPDARRGHAHRRGDSAELAGSSASADARRQQPVHRQLAAVLAAGRRRAPICVRRCLVLLADHELNASTFVARCVASTGATPYAVVSAALAALSGRRHGGASARAEALFHEIGRDESGSDGGDGGAPGPRRRRCPGSASRSIPTATRAPWRSSRRMPRRGRKPAPASPPPRWRRVQLTGQYPNVDFALAAAATALGLPPGAALGLFVVGRIGRLDRARDRAVRQRRADPAARPLYRQALAVGR